MFSIDTETGFKDAVIINAIIARNMRWRNFMPEKITMESHMTPRIMADPKSGCKSTKSAGTPT